MDQTKQVFENVRLYVVDPALFAEAGQGPVVETVLGNAYEGIESE